MTVPFARILGVEHAADHELPAATNRIRIGEGVVSLYNSN
jgi:hypothetical protein